MLLSKFRQEVKVRSFANLATCGTVDRISLPLGTVLTFAKYHMHALGVMTPNSQSIECAIALSAAGVMQRGICTRETLTCDMERAIEILDTMERATRSYSPREFGRLADAAHSLERDFVTLRENGN
jgi:hypothetical protein